MSDLISREKAIEDLQNGDPSELYEIEDIKYWLNSLPSAEPRKKRKWKGYKDGDPNWQRDDGSPIFLICSECHETVINNGSAHWNFCPNCGADMREGGEE